MTSQSIGGHVFPNFGMLNAKIASSLNRIIFNQHLRKGINVEEQRAQGQDRFLRRKQIAHMIFLIYFLSLYTEMTLKILIQDGNKLYVQVKYPRKMSWKVVQTANA